MTLYRGYDIHPINKDKAAIGIAMYAVWKDGQKLHEAKNEDQAMNWIDADRRAQRAAS